MDVNPIEAKVAKVLSRTEVALNRGDEHGVMEGMRFAILAKDEALIVDPDTQEQLGSVPLVKAVVKVVSTREKMSIARTFRELTIPSRGTNFQEIFAPRSERKSREQITTSGLTLTDELGLETKHVEVGDQAREVVGDEYVGLG